jgi:hypothetical protein
MLFSISNRVLLRGFLAGAVVIAGASACSRSDRTETASDTTAAVLPDTMSDQATTTPATPPSGADTAAGYRGMERDTSTAPDTTTIPPEPADTARAITDTSETSAAPVDTTTSVESADAEGEVALQARVDTARAEADVTAEVSVAAAGETDTAAIGDVSADTATAGYAEMARDTSTTPEQIDTIAQAEAADTMAQAEGDVALQATVDTVGADTTVDVSADVAVAAESDTAVIVGDSAVAAQPDTSAYGHADTAAIQAQADTTAEVPAEVAVETSPDVDTPGPRAKEDTISTKADSLAQYHEGEHVRSPEDSAEAYGYVSPEEDTGDASVSQEDQEDVAAAEAPTDEVGAAAIGGNVTGADAVASMTRQGVPCVVVDPESDETVRWDMSSTPVTLNPCGLGSMNLSKIWTAESGLQE